MTSESAGGITYVAHTVLDVRRWVYDGVSAEPTRTHARALARRIVGTFGLDHPVGRPRSWAAAVALLAARVTHPASEASGVAGEWGLVEWELEAVLGEVRSASEYRAYIGEWIREGCPDFAAALPIAQETDVGEDGGDDELWGIALSDRDLSGLDEDVSSGVVEPTTLAPAIPHAEDIDLGEAESTLPRRWKADVQPYTWQIDAAQAWEQNGGRGIMQVVTGAGKTLLAVFLYARLLERAERTGEAPVLLVIVPRIELARQWDREIRRLLDLQNLSLGQYHSLSKCLPARQDILITTQDSGRRLIPGLRFDRPVMLVADECHRLGAPAASKILARNFTWTLGLSATPERGGDMGFEKILEPSLGPIVWKYGYRDAVRDGIIARFSIARLKVRLSSEESEAYAAQSDRITRLLDALKGSYTGLRRVPHQRFWQMMGELKKNNPDDARFDALTAAASERRSVLHFAAEKFEIVAQLAKELRSPRKTLCFHERIEAAGRLVTICQGAGRAPAPYHSAIPEPLRTANLERFRHGKADWLIACKSLDEGLDIPSVDTIVIAAATRSPRQLIQRLGRALRRKSSESKATVFIMDVEGIEDGSLDGEALADLRDAADELVELLPGDIASWLAGRALATAGVIEPTRESSPAQARALRQRSNPEPRNPRNSIRRTFSSLGAAIRQNLRPSSWTGTAGNRSYYDKDSSPD